MLIRFGLGGQLSGSVAGVVAGHNKGGQYLRNRSIPTNPNSSRQQTVRSAFATAALTWGNLTSGQRAAWEAYASQTPVLNRLGESITVSGFNMFVRTNAYLQGLGIALVTAAPLTPGLSSIGTPTAIGLSVASGASLVTTNADAGVTLGSLMQYGPPVSPGVTFYGGPYSLFTTATMTATGFAAQPQIGVGRYGAPVVGELRPMRVRSITTDGKLTPTYSEIVTVVA
jgi:hypothetical protein